MDSRVLLSPLSIMDPNIPYKLLRLFAEFVRAFPRANTFATAVCINEDAQDEQEKIPEKVAKRYRRSRRPKEIASILRRILIAFRSHSRLRWSSHRRIRCHKLHSLLPLCRLSSSCWLDRFENRHWRKTRRLPLPRFDISPKLYREDDRTKRRTANRGWPISDLASLCWLVQLATESFETVTPTSRNEGKCFRCCRLVYTVQRPFHSWLFSCDQKRTQFFSKIPPFVGRMQETPFNSSKVSTGTGCSLAESRTTPGKTI